MMMITYMYKLNSVIRKLLIGIDQITLVTWTPWWYGQPSSIEVSDYRSKKGCNFLEALGFTFWGGKEYGGSQNYEVRFKETNRQTLTFASNAQLANINPGDFMRVVGTSNIYEYAYVRSVDAANSQITINKNTSVTTGQQLETLATTGTHLLPNT